MTPRHAYLDQNHWIYMAKDYWGKPHKPEHRGIACRLLENVASDRIRLPLSVLHLIEHLRAESAARRERLARVFDRFSCSWYMASWSSVLPAEIHLALGETFGVPPRVPEPEIFGRGLLFGLGPKQKKLLLEGRTEHQFGTLESIAALPGALLDLLTYPNEPGRQFQNVIISQCDHTNAAAIEARRLKAKPHSATVRRRAVYAGYTLDHQELIFTALNALGRRPEEFLALGIPGLSSFWPRVSSLDIDCELTLYRDRQWERPVCPNDVRDIGHLALAVPYCDIVVTENFWARALEETGLAKKYGTIACADLTGLLEQYKAE